jgi:nitronate monooxygenase
MTNPPILRTRVTDLLGCDYPIVQAGMGGPARSELCAAVSNAGAFGCLGMVKERPEMIRAEIEAVRERTTRPFGVNLVPSVTDTVLLEEELSICFEARVHTMVFFWEVLPDVITRARNAGCRVLYQVGSISDAVAAEDAGADAIICQGFEAGGHVRGSITSLVLVPQVAAAVRVPILGSGGFGSGASLAAALALGAEGIHCGTVFLATTESFAHDYHKQRIVEASSQSTVYNDVFAVGWPPCSPVRTIANSITELYADDLLGHGPEDFPQEVIAKEGGSPVLRFSTSSPLRNTEGDLEALALYSGQICGIVDGIRPAGELVQQMVEEARQALMRIRRIGESDQRQ